MFLFPFLNSNFTKPPRLYDLMNGMALNKYGQNEDIINLADKIHGDIFNFSYPLSDKVNKDEFEKMILNHFIMRRIAYETYTSWRISLSVKLNEIMPNYNKLFDVLDEWNIFKDGESYKRTSEDSRVISENSKQDRTGRNQTNSSGQTSNNNNITLANTESVVGNTETSSTTTTNNTNENVTDATTTGTTTDDLRHSELPQNELSNVQNGTYINDYNYNTQNTNSTNHAESSGSSEGTENQSQTVDNHVESSKQETHTQTASGTNENESVTTIADNNKSEKSVTDSNTFTETFEKDVSNKLDIYNNFLQNRQNIMTLIFKDLECLFFQVID